MAVTGTIVAVGASLYSADQQRKADKEQRRAQKKANEVERRRAALANQAEKKAAAAQLASARASNISAGLGYGGGGVGSSILGANVGMGSDLGSQIGLSNINLAASYAQNLELQRGADKAARYKSRAGYVDAVSSTSFGVAGLFGGK